jgi:hypothetical protein
MNTMDAELKKGDMCDQTILSTILHHDALLRGCEVYILLVLVSFSTNPEHAGYQVLGKALRMPRTREEYATSILSGAYGAPLMGTEAINLDDLVPNMHAGAYFSSRPCSLPTGTSPFLVCDSYA